MPYYTTASTGTSACVWMSWNGATNAADTTTNGPWYQWCQTGTTASTLTISTNCWVQWNNGTAVTNVVQPRVASYQPPPETAEQKAARVVQEAKWKTEREAAERKRIAAETRAEELFHEHLTEPQRKEVKEKRHFHIVSEKGKRYRIHIDSGSGNVSELGDDGKVAQRYCAHPRGVPKFDQILAQKLALEVCEHEFLRVANRCG